MEGSTASRPAEGGGFVAIAPFAGQAELVQVLGALGARTQSLRDLDELASLAEAGGRLVLDVDHVATEDIGWIRRILVPRADWSLVCTGRDAGTRNARALLAIERSRWLGWPPTLDELRGLAGATGKSLPSAPAAIPAPAASAAPEIQRAAPPSPSPTAPPSTGLAREQIALLADISQRLELAFAAVRESGRLSEAELESPSIEMRRLLRFTRTLSCLISPPPRGDEEFDLAALIEEQLAALTLRARKGPRFQPRQAQEGRVEFVVRADRAAVALAFESLLQLARLCAGQGETVRVVYTPQSSGELLIAIEFPAGPLTGLSNEQLADANQLRERLPELGPNDLAAAAAILASQGGGLIVRGNGNGQLSLQARLPLARLTQPPRQPASSARGTGNDPFA